MATAAESAQSRDAAETQAEALYRAAVLYVAIAALAGEEPDEDVDPASPLMRAATALALALIRSIPSRYGTDLSDMSTASAKERAAELAPGIADTARRHAQEHFATVADRVSRIKPSPPAEDVIAEFRNDTAWQRAAARTAATRMAAETAMDLAKDVDEFTGIPHRIMWISRGDTKVRRTHRRLHGRTREPGKAFKVWPSGQKLAFPGDPRAPLDETINCRCSLLMVPESQAWKAHEVFQVPDADFDLVASAVPVMDRAANDLAKELGRLR